MSDDPAMATYLMELTQTSLRRLGYLQGAPDARYAARTRHAIEQFQRASGLPVDGVPSWPLLRALRAPGAVAMRSSNRRAGIALPPPQPGVAGAQASGAQASGVLAPGVLAPGNQALGVAAASAMLPRNVASGANWVQPVTPTATLRSGWVAPEEAR